jgi:hypothetical protein
MPQCFIYTYVACLVFGWDFIPDKGVTSRIALNLTSIYFCIEIFLNI